jgi:regulator of replication initiation timing
MYEQIEAMIHSMEEMIRNAGDFEKHIKAMMENEGRNHGIELDRRHSARDMWETLMEHMQTNAAEEHAELMTEPADPNMHMHEDGLEHTHEDGDLPHSHPNETNQEAQDEIASSTGKSWEDRGPSGSTS